MTRILLRLRPSGTAVLSQLILAHANRSAAFGRDVTTLVEAAFGWSCERWYCCYELPCASAAAPSCIATICFRARDITQRRDRM